MGSSFLADLELRPFELESITDLEPVGLAIGPGSGGLEVIVTRTAHKPTQEILRKAWKARQGRRAVPVLLAALYGNHAALCGPSGDQPPVYLDLDPAQAEAICRAALQEPNRHAALRLLHSVLPEIRETAIPGLYNAGLFATHELLHGVPARADWVEALGKSRELKSKRGRPLLEALGYQVSDTTQQYSVLRTAQGKIAVAVFLDRAEATDAASERFGGMTPVQYALAKADEENLDYVVVDHGASLRIYSAGTGTGVGRRGRTETFIEAHLGLLPDDRAAYLWLLFSGEALSRTGAFEEILERSNDYAAGLGGRLRERIYDDVVPLLAVAIARARNLDEPGPEELSFTYEMALTVLFRLLFIAYAEDKDLLPYRSNELYKARSLKQKARELADLRRRAATAFDESTSLWEEVFGIFRVVDTGMPREWGVPAYNGGLFSDRADVSLAGAALAAIKLPNAAFGEALTSLLVDETAEGIGPVDFRSLGVREFGTIYEGLLGSELSVAETPLAVDKDGFYVPAETDEAAEITAGEYYLHDTSGKRKSSGSYYTKTFAVDHLLDHALEPALREHLQRLDGLDDRAAAAAFFDFRVADIAMGSGHFLVAAVDRIERGLGSYLVRRPLPDVVTELRRLRSSALKEMETAAGSADGLDIDNDQLLRRQIARRCVYGVDINSIAVQLARLSLWIHTFVPGLPLSFLDHNIVCGNSLVGIATMDEVSELLGGEQGSLLDNFAEQYLAPAREGMKQLAKLSDADARQIEAAREAAGAARSAISETEALFDVLTAARLPEMNYTPSVTDLSEAELKRLRVQALELLQGTPPFHFPIAFPEVFLRQRAGFDVIIGNPPWEKTQVEEHEFWARYFPGLRGLSQAEREENYKKLKKERLDLVEQFQKEVDAQETFRSSLMSGPYPGMGSGHPDLYKAFCWRFWNLICGDGGRLGVVLPRSALSAKGSTEFRREVFSHTENVGITTLLNTRGWVFDEAEHRYTIGLVALEKREAEKSQVKLRGPYPNLSRYRDGMVSEPAVFYGEEIESWNDTASLPLLPTDESVEVFAQLRKAPRLDLDDGSSWRARPYTELHATNDKKHMDLESKDQPAGFWPVFKGESFDIWTPDTGTYYAWADPRVVLPHLLGKRLRGWTLSSSVFHDFKMTHPKEWFEDEATLPCMKPRIVFRQISRTTDTRTVRVALIPPNVLITNHGPYLIWPRGDSYDQAFLLGILSSLPLDWYARRFVEVNMSFFIFNPFPIPRPDRDDPFWQRAIELSGRLACPDERFAD
ncbi:MAG: Eco57I restriction-modification methylase domain-containing protein [Thermoleophilia bacterium]